MQTEALEKLCEKIGVTAEQIVPEVSRYLTVRYAAELIVCVVIFVVSLTVALKVWKRNSDKGLSDMGDMVWGVVGGTVVGGAVAFFMAIIVWALVIELIGIAVSPTSAVVRYLLGK